MVEEIIDMVLAGILFITVFPVVFCGLYAMYCAQGPVGGHSLSR